MSRPFADADAFRAVAHPVRRRILDSLRHRAHTAGELAEQVRCGRSSLSRHLLVLRGFGLVTQQRHGTQRVYTLRPAALRILRDWISPYSHLLDAEAIRAKAG